MTFLGGMKGKIVFLMAQAINKDLRGMDITSKLDDTLDREFGEQSSEKIQRGPLTNFLLEMVEGLWEEDKKELLQHIESWKESLTKEESWEARKSLKQ